MANPNIVNVTSILGNTTYLTPSGTTAVVLLANAASSGHVYKIDQIVAANVTSTAATTIVSVYSPNTTTTQGSAPAGGTAYPIAWTVTVPANASLIVVDKTTALYLQEGTCISVTSGTGSAITYTVSYEDIS